MKLASLLLPVIGALLRPETMESLGTVDRPAPLRPLEPARRPERLRARTNPWSPTLPPPLS